MFTGLWPPFYPGEAVTVTMEARLNVLALSALRGSSVHSRFVLIVSSIWVVGTTGKLSALQRAGLGSDMQSDHGNTYMRYII